MKITPAVAHSAVHGHTGSGAPARSGPVSGQGAVSAEQGLPQAVHDDWVAQVTRAADRFNRIARALGRNQVQLRVHEATRRITVKVVAEETGEVLREFPPERLLDVLASLQATVGLLIDEKI
jgi:uncharacterized FlaG/YvyC family protein